MAYWHVSSQSGTGVFIDQHHSNGTLLLGSLLATYQSSRLDTLSSATAWLLTTTNTFDVAHFATIITVGCAEQTLGGSVAIFATSKTTITSPVGSLHGLLLSGNVKLRS